MIAGPCVKDPDVSGFITLVGVDLLLMEMHDLACHTPPGLLVTARMYTHGVHRGQ